VSEAICNQLPLRVCFSTASHQERLNGTGYPDGRGEKIPFIIQVFQLVNVADAIISKRLRRKTNEPQSDRPYWMVLLKLPKK
jgi:putative two-component system response regulator